MSYPQDGYNQRKGWPEKLDTAVVCPTLYTDGGNVKWARHFGKQLLMWLNIVLYNSTVLLLYTQEI